MVRFIIGIDNIYNAMARDYLHSNMVRFIISIRYFESFSLPYLHSNMVRFIMNIITKAIYNTNQFTFQYG